MSNVQPVMYPRLASAVCALLAVAATACGSDADSRSSDSTLSSITTAEPSSGEFTHPSGADDVVVSAAELGGFTTREFAFQQTPNPLISGDGLVYMPGAQIEIFPGPLLPSIQVQTISEQGIQNVLGAADRAGLLTELDYAVDSNIADATTATLIVAADGSTFVHEAYALGASGPGGGTTPERAALAQFLVELSDLPNLAGVESLGPSRPFEPTEYAIQALPVDDVSAFASDDLEPEIVEWPPENPVRLGEASECTVVAAIEVGDLLADATQLTFFTDAGVDYQLLARPVLPGDDC